MNEVDLSFVQTDLAQTLIKLFFRRCQCVRHIIIEWLRISKACEAGLDRSQLCSKRRAHQREALVNALHASIESPEVFNDLLEFSKGNLMVLDLDMNS